MEMSNYYPMEMTNHYPRRVYAPDFTDRLLSAFGALRTWDITSPSETRKSVDLKIDGATIKNVIYNAPATIVIWSDGDKTVVKCQKGDTYNPELGLAMCIVKKCCGNKGSYNDVFKKWLPKEAANNDSK